MSDASPDPEKLKKYKTTGQFGAFARGAAAPPMTSVVDRAAAADHTVSIQARLFVFSTLLGLGLAAAVAGLFWARWERLRSDLLQIGGMTEARLADMTGEGGALVVWLVVVSVVFLLANGLMITIVSQRLVGPVRRIGRHLSALREGDFSARTQLRAHDAFGDVVADLNQVSETLERRLGGKAGVGVDADSS